METTNLNLSEEELSNIIESTSVNTDTENNTDNTESINAEDKSKVLIKPIEDVSQESMRFSGTEWFKISEKSNIGIIGLGGIGSHLAFQIARTFPNHLLLVDGDIVDDTNMAGQFYTRTTTGTLKTYSTRNNIENFCNYNNISLIHAKLTHANINDYSVFQNKIIMTGLDNMDARKLIYNKWKEFHKGDPEALFIDGRCSVEDIVIYCIQGDDESAFTRYEEEFFTSEEAEATRCSAKQTTYIASMTASLMVSCYINWLNNKVGGFTIIPFKYEFNQYTAKLTTTV